MTPDVDEPLREDGIKALKAERQRSQQLTKELKSMTRQYERMKLKVLTIGDMLVDTVEGSDRSGR